MHAKDIRAQVDRFNGSMEYQRITFHGPQSLTFERSQIDGPLFFSIENALTVSVLETDGALTLINGSAIFAIRTGD